MTIKKNAFTLIELLAVLVILAVIALIVFPLIGDVINDSKMKAFKSSIDGLEHAVDLDYQKDYYTGDREYSYEDGTLTLTSVKGESKNKNIKVEGIIENGIGKVNVNKKGEISLQIHNEVWCAIKDYTDKTITVEEKTGDNCNFPRTVTKVMEPLIGTEVNNNDPDGNLRYVGPSPNNYVSFNGELWRIIGVFNSQAKIIRDGYYSNSSAWDSSSGKLNNWEVSALKSSLNDAENNFLSSIQTDVPKSYIDLTYIWNIGAVTSTTSEWTRENLYNLERGTTPAGAAGSKTTWTGAIGLLYASDYAYSTSGDKATCDSTSTADWKSSVNATAFAECSQNSWIYNIDDAQWLINSNSDSTGSALLINRSTGHISSESTSNRRATVRPVLYLKSNVKIVGGKGTEQEPYELGM